ncbi:hypothetical protein FOL47_002838 [Perkinsus chesapeaki]|uniref:EF-hand domain-containing protein n=1 Tax=Perkinsus chesapeaki TaxID=330153 RepID=A0A7J6MCZ8_PERCH|nr:hypothetical protein FOL47_002838 [Perkinsus chesapeaki]
MGQEISELNKLVGSQEDSGDYIQNSSDLGGSKNSLNVNDHQLTNEGFDMSAGKGGGYLGNSGLFLNDQTGLNNFSDGYGTTGQLGEQQSKQPIEHSPGGGMSPSQQQQLHQLLLRHQQQMPYQPHQQQQSKPQTQGFLAAQNRQVQQLQKPSTRRQSPLYAESLYAMLSAKNLPSLETSTGKPVKRLTDEEITKIIKEEGCDEIDIYDTSVPAELKKILSTLESSGAPQPLNRSAPKLPDTRLSPNAIEFVPGRPYGTKLEESIAFRLHQHASARWDQKLRSQQRSQATEECPATAILHKSRTRPVLRHFDTTAVLQQEQCPKYRHGSLIQRFIVGNSARAAMEQLPPPLPKAATYADGKVCGEALESEYKVASVLDEIFPANVTDEHEILWRRVRESLMQQRSTNTRERRRQALNKYGPDIIEIVTEAARCEPSYATAKARGDGSETSRDRVREDRQRAKSNAILFKQMVLQGFRKKLIARFGSLQKAFSRIALVGSERDMKIKEFSNTLIKTKICSDLAEARMIFDAIDINGDGGVSVQEFMDTLESAAEITSLEGFRRRLIMKYGSLSAALNHIGQIWLETDDGLDERQFVKVISQCGVLHEEAELLFKQLDLDGSGGLDKEELFSAMTAVSPFLFLEEMQRVMKEKCDILQIHKVIPKILNIRRSPEDCMEQHLARSDMKKLAAKFNFPAEPLTVRHAELVHKFLSDAIPAAIPLVPDNDDDETDSVQNQAANSVDQPTAGIDRRGSDSSTTRSRPSCSPNPATLSHRRHFVSGLRLATPDFSLSEFRRKIINRYYAIMDALYLVDVTGQLALSLEDYASLLEPLQILPAETKRFFGKITLGGRMEQIPIYEFMLGLIVFCPQILVMEIQAPLVRKYRSVPDALEEFQKRHHDQEVKRWNHRAKAEQAARIAASVGLKNVRHTQQQHATRLMGKLWMVTAGVAKQRRKSETSAPPDADTLTLSSFKRFIRRLVGLRRTTIRDQTLNCIFYLLDTAGSGSTTWGELGSALAALQPPAHKRMSTPARYAYVANTVNECIGPARRQAIAARAHVRLHHMASALGRRAKRESRKDDQVGNPPPE